MALKLALAGAAAAGSSVVLSVVVLSGAGPPGAASAAIQPGNPLEGCAHPRVTQLFGPTDVAGEPAVFGFPHYHTGIDLACPYGTPVHDVGGAGVAHTQLGDAGFGNYVVVQVATANGTYFVRYAHLAAI